MEGFKRQGHSSKRPWKPEKSHTSVSAAHREALEQKEEIETEYMARKEKNQTLGWSQQQ